MEVFAREFEQVSNAELKAAVVAKFGSVLYFCRLSGYNAKELYQSLRYRSAKSSAYLAEVFATAREQAKPEQLVGYHFTEALRKAIAGKLLRYTSVVAFCEQYPQFSNVFISRITGSRYCQRITPKIRALMEVLEVENQ